MIMMIITMIIIVIMMIITMTIIMIIAMMIIMIICLRWPFDQVREGLTECWAAVRDKVEFAENGGPQNI